MESTMDIEQKIIKLITEQLGMRHGDVTPESTHESLGMDSLDDIEVIMAIEEVFDLEIDDSELEKLLSVQALTEYVTKTLEEINIHIGQQNKLKKTTRGMPA